MVCKTKKCCPQENVNNELKQSSNCPCIKHKKKKRKPCDVCCKADNIEDDTKGPCDCSRPAKKPACKPDRRQPTLMDQAMRKQGIYFQRCACLYKFNTDAIFEKYGITRYTTPGLNVFEDYLPEEPPPPPKKKGKKMTKAEREEMLRANGIDPRHADKATGFYAKSADNRTGADFYKSLPNNGKQDPRMPKEGRLMGISRRHVRCFLNNEHALFRKMKEEADEKNRAYLEKEKEKMEKQREKLQAKLDAKNAKSGGDKSGAGGAGGGNGSKKGKKRKKKAPVEPDYLELLTTNFETSNRQMLSAMCQNIIQQCIDADTSCKTDEEKANECLKRCPCCFIEPDIPKQKKKKKKPKT